MNETLEIIASMPNLSIITGLKLRTADVAPFRFTEVLHNLKHLKKLKVDCSE